MFVMYSWHLQDANPSYIVQITNELKVYHSNVMHDNSNIAMLISESYKKVDIRRWEINIEEMGRIYNTQTNVQYIM